MASEGARPREARCWVEKTSAATVSEFSRGRPEPARAAARIKSMRVKERLQSSKGSVGGLLVDLGQQANQGISFNN